MCVIPEGFGNDFDPVPFDEFERAKERLLERKSEEETAGEKENRKENPERILPFFSSIIKKIFLSNGDCGEKRKKMRDREYASKSKGEENKWIDW